ncbi:MAG: hypothetical protein M9894_04055 [Planctomycetes bacterium]|nr:hypothetical protein [Planctomycetota bacterium]
MSEAALLLALAATTAAAAWASRGRPPLERALVALLPLLLALAAASVAAEALAGLFRAWNDARLAPVVAWTRGYPLYPGVDGGPLLGLMYPPLAALAYLPAAWGRTPEQAVGAGLALAQVYYFAPPAAALLVAARRGATPWPATAACLAVFVLLGAALPSLAGAAFWVHADAPALGLAALATAAVHLGRPSLAVHLAAAVAAALAVLSKQVAAPLLVALPLAALVYDGGAAARRCALCVAGVAGAAAALAAGALDLDDLLLDALVVPSRQPWTGPALPTAAGAGLELLLHGLGPLLVAGASWAALAPQGAAALDRLRAERWTVWLLVALLMAPTAVLGRCKVGGDVNALSFSTYFLTVGAGLAWLRAAALPPAPRRDLCVALLLALGLLACVPALERAAALPRLVARLPENPERTGLALARARPGAVYFPFHPLVSLYAEGRAYHLSDAVYSRVVAGVEVGEEHVRAHLPPRLERVAHASAADARLDFSQVYLPGFTRVVEGTPGAWVVLTR